MTSALLYTLGVLVFVVGLAISIGLHELGHLIPAKRFGVKVTQYFVGFGRTLWSFKRGETEYGLKALPLGGYVKLVGMLPPEKGGDPLALRQSNTGMFTQIISDARSAEMEHIKPGDEDRLFYRLPWWKKVIVMGAGPSVNIAIAFVLFWVVFATAGNANDIRYQPVIADVSACIVPADEDGRECTAADPVAPAFEAGIREGDRIVAFNGVPVTSWEQLSTLIRGNDEGDAVVVYERGGQQTTVTTNTTVTARPTSIEDPTLVQVGFFGVRPTGEFATGGPIYTVVEMGAMSKDVAAALVTLPAKVFDAGQAVFGLQERDPEGPVSIVGGGRFAGEATASELIPAQDKVLFLITLLAGFNFFIGMFNFVPLLPLDGGHIAGALYEALRRGWARIRRKPDPGFVDVAKLMPVAYVGALALLVMGGVLIIADLVVPVSLT